MVKVSISIINFQIEILGHEMRANKLINTLALFDLIRYDPE